MAGALTANAVTTRVVADDTALSDTEIVVADITLLSPTVTANNVLLTGVFVVSQLADATVAATAQWYRCTPGATLGATVPGTAVGDPFTFGLAGESIGGTYCVQAIDKGAGYVSAYALGVVTTDFGTPLIESVYVDAVLFD